MTKPISPKEVGKYQTENFPDFVFEAFNQLIAANYSGRSARVYQKAVVDRMMELSPNTNKSSIFSLGYLNVEEAYRAAGWKVSYDKPGYNESYPAYFDFERKSNA